MIAAIRPRAKDDVIRQFRWYLIKHDAPDVAQRFLDRVQETVERIVEMPGVGAPTLIGNPALAGLRSCPVSGFDNIRVYYLATTETLRILRVLHGAQDVGAILATESDETLTEH